MGKAHPLCTNTHSFGISAKLQELVCLLSQQCVFEEVEELLKALLGLDFSAKQAQRVSEHYGGQIEGQVASFVSEQKPVPQLDIKDKQEAVYVMFDGSMVFTREEGWKEIKVGRFFKSSANIAIQENRNEIVNSLYVCHLGGHEAFLEKLQCYARPYKKKVCIADGAKWIWNGVADYLEGEIIEILDFYHALEKISIYAAIAYTDEHARKQWLEKQKQQLLNNQVDEIIKTLRITKGNPKAEKACLDTLNYYENNRTRMQYKTYLEAGYLIGSGPIEAAHRNVVQQRLKLSGQRWSIDGAQYIINLRASKKSNTWNNIIDCIKNAA